MLVNQLGQVAGLLGGLDKFMLEQILGTWPLPISLPELYTARQRFAALPPFSTLLYFATNPFTDTCDMKVRAERQDVPS